MPIEIRHDVPAGAAATGAALAGAGLGALRQWEAKRRAGEIIVQNDAAQMRQVQSLNAQAKLQQASIEARAELQKSAAQQAMEHTALRAGLGEELQRQKFNQQLQMLDAEAKARASQVEFQYTTEQRRQFARLNQARQDIMQSPRFTQQQKREALRILELQQAGIQPSMMPRDPNKPQFPEGKDIGQTWLDEQGSILSREPDGTIKLIQRWDQGPEAAKVKAEQSQQEKALEIQARREEKLLDIRRELLTEPIKQKDALGNEKITYRDVEEVDRLMEKIMPQPPQQDRPPEQWWDRAEQQGLKVEPKDKTLPEHVGYAQSLVRTLASQYGSYDAIPDEQKPSYLQAADLLRQYREAIQ